MKNIYTGFSFTFELSTSKYVNAIMEDPLIPHLSKCMFFCENSLYSSYFVCRETFFNGMPG
jgi:hypothetical protein